MKKGKKITDISQFVKGRNYDNGEDTEVFTFVGVEKKGTQYTRKGSLLFKSNNPIYIRDPFNDNLVPMRYIKGDVWYETKEPLLEHPVVDSNALTDAEKLKNTAVELQRLRDDLQGKLDEFEGKEFPIETPPYVKAANGCLESGYKIAAKYAISRIDKILEG